MAYKKDKNEADDFSWEESDNVPGVEVPGLAPPKPSVHQQAMDLIQAHMEDPDYEEPIIKILHFALDLLQTHTQTAVASGIAGMTKKDNLDAIKKM